MRATKKDHERPTVRGGCKMATDLDVDRDIFNGRIAIAIMVSQGGFRPRCQCPPCGAASPQTC